MPEVTAMCERDNLVSVLMPVLNGEQYLREAVDSIMSQTYREIELVVVDDGSSDRTPEILASIDDGRLVVVRNEANIGIAESLNVALRHASGEWIARMDADDRSLPERLERQLRYMQVHPEAELVSTWARLIDGEGAEIGVHEAPQRPEEIARQMLGHNCIVHGSVFAHASTMRAAGGYRPLPCAEDYDLWMRLLDGGECIGAIPEPLYELRCHAVSETRTRADEFRICASLILTATAHRRETGTDPLDAAGSTEAMQSIVDAYADGNGVLGRRRRTLDWWSRAESHLDAGRVLRALPSLSIVFLRNPAYGPFWRRLRTALSNRLRGETPR